MDNKPVNCFKYVINYVKVQCKWGIFWGIYWLWVLSGFWADADTDSKW